MTEAIRPQSSEDSPEALKQSWEKLFMALLDLSTKTGISVLELDLKIENRGKVIIPRGHLIDENYNPRLIVVDVYKKGELIQRAIATAEWENGHPMVMDCENTSGSTTRDTFNPLSMIEGLANNILQTDTSAFLKQRN